MMAWKAEEKALLHVLDGSPNIRSVDDHTNKLVAPRSTNDNERYILPLPNAPIVSVDQVQEENPHAETKLLEIQ